MKNLFLIPLMAMLCTVMAWSAVRSAGTYQDLQNAIAAADPGDVIELTANIAYPASPTRTDLINIDKSIILDGKGYAITGCGFCNYRVDGKATYQPTHIAINANRDKSDLNVVIKNLKLDKDFKKYALNGLDEEAVSGCPTSSERYFGVGVFDGVSSLLLEKDTFTTSKGGNAQIICVQGTSSTPLELTINESYLNATQGSGYPTYFLKPVDLEINNCIIEGYCGLYFKPDLAPFSTSNYPRAYWYGTGNYGSTGSEVVANNTLFVSKNPHDTGDNDFGILAMEEGGINITLNNCGLDAEALKSVSQCLFLLSSWAPLENRATNNVLTITGDNSHINGSLIDATWYAVKQNNGASTLYENGFDSKAGKARDPFSAFTGDIQINIEGGTYNFNPKTYQYNMHVSTDDPHYADGTAAPTVFTKKGVKIPDGYDVSEIKQGDVTLYRVVRIAKEKSPGVKYDLNDLVAGEGEDYGDNPVSSFDLSTGAEMELNQTTTTAGYVQVKDNGSSEGTTVKVGKVENEGTPSEAKVDQKLVINNGLDVQGNSQVVVQAGSTLQIGEGGITTEDPENIVIEADDKGAASLLLDPTITVNQTPNLTVKMLAKQIGRNADGDFYWHRFAMPVAGIGTWEKEGSLVSNGATTNYPTYVYAWDYEANDWDNIAPNEMDPLKGYTLTLASDYIHVNGSNEVVEADGEGGNLYALQDVTYTFKGNLVGNTDQPLNFTKEGFNFFGNSYTGYMHAYTMLEGILSEHVDGTIYMWNSSAQNYAGVSKYKLEKGRGLDEWQKEVAPMQTFILRLRGADSADEDINYASAIWGNPRYGNAAPAPARRTSAAEVEDAYLEIKVTAANGKSDRMDFTEMSSKSDAFDNGFDTEKYMNRKSLNLYAEVEGMNLSSVVTDDLLGKTLSLQTLDDMNYTMTFANVEGNEYALLDKATNEVVAISNGATYTFSAQPNSIVENRFEIVSIHKVPTAVESTDAPVKARGIYTMLGQYMGEDINVLPAGVYVVNGVKIVK